MKPNFGSSDNFLQIFVNSFEQLVRSSSEIFCQSLSETSTMLAVRTRHNQVVVDLEYRGRRPIKDFVQESFQVILE
jgi:hypothetical protein